MAIDSAAMADKMFSTLENLQSTRQGVATAVLSNALTLYENGNYKKAAAAFRQTLALNPQSTDAYNYLAQSQIKLGDKKEAIKAYSLSLKVDSTQDDVHVNLANIYIEEKEYTKAEKSLKAASIADPTSALPHYTLGLMQLQLDQPAKAEASFRKAIHLSSGDKNALYGLGSALSKQGEYSDAVTYLKKAVSLDRKFAAAMSELGSAYVKLGDTKKAQEQIKALKALHTTTATGFAKDLENELAHPKITGVNTAKSTFNTKLGSVPLLALDPSTFIEAGSMKEMTLTFQFDTDMDASSITNVGNWSIGRSSGITAGLYDNGLYKPTDRSALSTIPARVTYDPTSNEATVYFSIYQNDDATGTLDASHLTFKFSGKDVNGKTMDTTADQYNGFAARAF